jgi:hypothetical protein
MAITKEDIEFIYKELYVTRNEPIPLESVPFFDAFASIELTPESVASYLCAEVHRCREYIKNLGNWSDIRFEKRLAAAKQLKDALFCPLEDVPLHINGAFSAIAAWRLKNAR